MSFEESLPLRLGERRVLAEPCCLSDPIDSSRMTLGLLPKIEARERDAKRRHATQKVREPAAGDDAVPSGHEGAEAELQRLRELGGREVGRHARQLRSRLRERLFGQIARRLKPVAHFGEEHAIRLVRGADARAKLLARMTPGERQLASKSDDVLEVQIGGLPACQPRSLTCHFRGDARIAVAIAANPRSESDGRGVERQRVAGRRGQRTVDRP